MDIKNIATRAVWTFVQTFLAAFVVTDMATAKQAALAGIAAVLSVVKTVAAEQLSTGA